MTAERSPVRLTVILPVAAPYREPLLGALAARADLELTVLYADAGQPSWDVPEDYFRVEHAYPAVHLRSWQLPRPGRTPIMFVRGMGRALTGARPDVIVASEYGPTAILARWWAARHGVPHLLFTECTSEIDTLLPPLQLRWQRRFARRAAGAIAVSSAARRRLLGFGVAPERVTVALQGADLGAIRAAPRAPEPPVADGVGTDEPAALRVLTVSRLVPDKNVGVLLRAVAQAAEDLAPRRVHVDVVGDGFLARRLTESAAELGVEAIFHGHLGATGLAELYADADVFCLLSSYEPFGVVVREAAAAGLAIITTPVVGAVGDCAIAGANAELVAVGDVSATAVALVRVLGDPARRAAMAAASRELDTVSAGTEVEAFATAVLSA